MDEPQPVRREGFFDSTTTAALLRDPAGFDPAVVLAAARDAYGPLNGSGVRVLSLDPGETATALLPADAAGGFLLDLDPPGWRSEWGGLLLFQGAGGRVHGFRPVPGALALFPASAGPMISLITPQGARRTSILGWWA